MKTSFYTATFLQDLFQRFCLLKFNIAKMFQCKVTLKIFKEKTKTPFQQTFTKSSLVRF